MSSSTAIGSAEPLSVPFKTVGDLKLCVDVYLPNNAKGKLPVFLWYHSGGLVNGSRRDMFLPAWLRDKVLARGWIFLSADYRLLLPSTGFDIFEDILSLGSFLSSRMTDRLAPLGISLDLDKLSVGGSSAGGYMSRVYSINVTPKPRAILSLYGMGGDFLNGHWVDPHPQGVRYNGGFTSREDVQHLLDDKGITEIVDSPMVPIEDARFAPGYTNDKDYRGSLYNYWQCFGLYLDHLTGIPGLNSKMQGIPHDDREVALPESVRPLFPQLRITELSPTVLVHGTEDTSVNIWESRKTYSQLIEAGVETELIEVQGAEHGCVTWPEKTRSKEAWDAFDRSFEFIVRHMQ